jgi:hypothetical protein
MQLGQQHHVLPPVLGIGDLTSDFTQFTSDLTSGNVATAFSDPISGIPAWAWLTGGIVVLMFFFGGSESRYTAHKRAAGKAAKAYKGAL